MLTWTTHDGSWYGNGFLIERVSQRAWTLVERTGDPANRLVREGPIPLATLPTLSACQYKAETIHRRVQLAELRRRLGLVAAGSGSMAVVTQTAPVLALIFAIIGAGALFELVSTWYLDLRGDARELTQ